LYGSQRAQVESGDDELGEFPTVNRTMIGLRLSAALGADINVAREVP
jgi:hypothetical protein